MKISSLVHLLMLAFGFTILLVVFRVLYSGSIMYLFFGWNLFLAAIPLALSGLLLHSKRKIMQVLLFSSWLLFFPNALYIVTDLAHLKYRYPVPLWFDVIIVFSAAVNSLIIGYASFHHVELFLRTKFTERMTSVILFGCLLLSSFGVYLGRFLRWNSWDVLFNPFGLITEIGEHLINPFAHPRTFTVTIVLTVFFSILYFTIKKLPDLVSKSK